MTLPILTAIIGMILMTLAIFLEYIKLEMKPKVSYIEPAIFSIGFFLVLAGVEGI